MSSRSESGGKEADAYAARLSALEAGLAACEGGLAIAFSGGVDSAVLLLAATRVLGEGALGVIADSPSLPRQELQAARDLAQSIGARLLVVGTDEGDDARYRKNDALRCYWCKGALFAAMQKVARDEGLAHVAYGENADDDQDDRPGRRAAVEGGVRAPLAEAGFSKSDVRRYAREAGLEVAEKPASACLASRIERGIEVTPGRLARVEKAERAISELGFEVLRVRHKGQMARLEVGQDELERATEVWDQISERLRLAGYESFELATYIPPGKRVRIS